MPSRRTRRHLALAGLLLAGAYAGGSGCARSGGAEPSGVPTSPRAAVIPFSAFLSGVTAARYADYAGRSGVAVRDEAAFEEMRRYLVQRYQAVEVTRSVPDGPAVFDCLRAPGRAASPPAPAAPPSGSSPATAVPGPGGICPTGSVPVRRVTLDELVRFATLGGFLGKGP